jgi:hypothetical protein
MSVNYDRKTFIEQATGVIFTKLFKAVLRTLVGWRYISSTKLFEKARINFLIRLPE